MQKYCVIARFDEDATEKLNSLKKGIEEICTFDGTKGWLPHITLACYENIDTDELCIWTKEYVAKHTKFKIYFSSLGVFYHNAKSDTDVIYAVPTYTKELTNFYYGFHDKFDEYCGDIGWFYSMTFGQPAMHSSITLCKTNEFSKTFKYLYDNFTVFEAIVNALEVYSIPMKLIARFELK